MINLFSLEKTLFPLVLIALMVCDLRLWRIPRAFALTAIFVGIFFGFLADTEVILTQRVLGAAGGFVALWSVLIISTWFFRRLCILKENEFGMGAGDPLMLAVIGSFMGYAKLPLVIFWGGLQGTLAYFVACIFPQLALEPPEGSRVAAMPFAAFIGLAALEILLWESCR